MDTQNQKLPRGLRNNNPLNIRHNPANKWQGRTAEQTDRAFVQFQTLQWGFRAAIRIITNWLKTGKAKTPEDIIKRWAPPSENNTAAYVKKACSLAELQPQSTIKPDDKRKICKLVRGMAIVENGVEYTHMFPLSLIQYSYELL